MVCHPPRALPSPQLCPEPGLLMLPEQPLPQMLHGCSPLHLGWSQLDGLHLSFPYSSLWHSIQNKPGWYGCPEWCGSCPGGAGHCWGVGWLTGCPVARTQTTACPGHHLQAGSRITLPSIPPGLRSPRHLARAMVMVPRILPILGQPLGKTRERSSLLKTEVQETQGTSGPAAVPAPGAGRERPSCAEAAGPGAGPRSLVCAARRCSRCTT